MPGGTRSRGWDPGFRHAAVGQGGRLRMQPHSEPEVDGEPAIPRPVRVLVVDDHPLFRYGLCTVLAAEPSIDVVGEAATGRDAVSAARAYQPDVVVMDLHLPDIDGIEATREIVGERSS